MLESRAVLPRIVLTLVGLALAAGCSGSQTAAAPSRTTVVAGFYPLAFAAERIGGASVEVTNLTPPGGEPHDVELSAHDVERVRSADVVLYLGRRFQPALEQAAADAEGNAVDLLAGMELDPHRGQHDGEGSAGDGSEHEAKLDPHVWLDPKLYAVIAERIGDALGHPEEASRFVRELHELDRDFRRGLAACRRREIVTSHAAFGYLAKRYRLEQIPLTGLSPEAEPSPRKLAEAVSKVRETGATTIFFETLVSPRLAETVARETNAETAVLNPLEGLTSAELERSDDYFSIMRRNLAELRAALGCR